MKKQETQSFDEVLKAEKELKQTTELPRSSGLHESIIKVMRAVKNIDKSMTVGSGQSSYKGVADKDVKQVIGSAMAENNLTCLPIDMETKVQVDRWSEVYNNQEKQKQSVFTEVKAKFLITHSLTGESITIVGYGHGVDSQDKSAGKATTYALKNALLYSFLVPTGAIDDTDNTHSSNIETPKNTKPSIDQTRFEKALQAISDGKYTIQLLKDSYELTDLQTKAIQLL